MASKGQDSTGATPGWRRRKLSAVIVACVVLFSLGAGWAVAKTAPLFGQREPLTTAFNSKKGSGGRKGRRTAVSSLSAGCQYVHHRLVCDSVPPDTTITAEPLASTTVTSANFAFTSTESGSKFECKLDAARWRSCGSPKSYSVSLGTHSFSVRALDASGNVDPTPAADTWAVEPTPSTSETPPPDTTPPDTTISSGPSGTTTSTSASFSFSSTEPGSSFECKLDSGSFAACSSPKAYSTLGTGAHSFSVRATDPAGNVDLSPATQDWTVEAASPPPGGSNCFAQPSSCGYPDPTNTGVPAGTALTASGSITVSTAGQVISGKDVTGQIYVNANNVTIENSRVTQTGNCGTTNTCGNYAIRVNSGVSGTVIRNVETRTEAGKTCEHDIRNQGGSSTVGENLYLHGCDSNWYGEGTLKNSYGIAKIEISADHVENVYFCSGAFTADHDTLFNPVEQTAVVFGDTICGGGNRYTVKNSLLAGGGFVFYPQANNSNPAGAQAVIEGNHIARCLGAERVGNGHHYCQGVTNTGTESPGDGHGYYPNGGSYGIGDYFSGPLTWANNVWDDNLTNVSAP